MFEGLCDNMTTTHKLASVAVAAFVAAMLIGAFSFPTTAFAAPKENPKTESGPRTNPNDKVIPGEETTTTTCTTPGGSTPRGHEPVDGECKGNDECTQTGTVTPGRSNNVKSTGTEEC
jgi:hypothetical protein